MLGILILVVLSSLAIIYPKHMYKKHFLFWILLVGLSSALFTKIQYLIFLYSGNLSCSVKKATILLLKWTTMCMLFSRYF